MLSEVLFNEYNSLGDVNITAEKDFFFFFLITCSCNVFRES